MRDDHREDPAAGAGEARLAHRIQEAMSTVVARLHAALLELEEAKAGAPPAKVARVRQLLLEATAGADRVGGIVRELKGLHHTTQPDLDLDEDTWDESRSGRRILVVDDDPGVVATLRQALGHYSLTAAESGPAALEALRSGGPFDLILCDLVMPGMNGRDVFQWITQHHPELAERVLFITGGALLEEQRQFLQKVTNPVLHKPFDTKTLRWVLAQSMRRAESGGRGRP